MTVSQECANTKPLFACIPYFLDLSWLFSCYRCYCGCYNCHRAPMSSKIDTNSVAHARNHEAIILTIQQEPKRSHNIVTMLKT